MRERSLVSRDTVQDQELSVRPNATLHASHDASELFPTAASHLHGSVHSVELGDAQTGCLLHVHELRGDFVRRVDSLGDCAGDLLERLGNLLCCHGACTGHGPEAQCTMHQAVGQTLHDSIKAGQLLDLGLRLGSLLADCIKRLDGSRSVSSDSDLDLLVSHR